MVSVNNNKDVLLLSSVINYLLICSTKHFSGCIGNVSYFLFILCSGWLCISIIETFHILRDGISHSVPSNILSQEQAER